MKKIFILLSVVLMGCEKCPDIAGRWVQPVPGMENVAQGFELKESGAAASINMATLVYKTWRRPDCDTIVMTGDSIGNGQTIEFSETYHISMPDNDTLVLTTDDGYGQTFTRE